eukprot:scaffold336_cov250-Pinguiococcus_pyrenoidosus.AAC.36
MRGCRSVGLHGATQLRERMIGNEGEPAQKIRRGKIRRAKTRRAKTRRAKTRRAKYRRTK